MPRKSILAPGLIALMATSAVGFALQEAVASTVQIEGPGIEVELRAGIMAGTLDDGIQVFSADDLAFMQQELADDAVQTTGRISIILADTGNGLALINLFDGSILPPRGLNDSTLGFNSLAGSGADRHWNTDSGGTVNWFDFGLTQMVDGQFEWQSGLSSEGFAWSNLQEGDVGTMSFANLGLDKLVPDMFQFVTYNGEAWEVAGTADFADGSSQLNLSFFVTNVPGPAALSLLAMAGVRSRRRRR
ncbi:MAG: hypothetical protein VX727_05835 [Planctomycetota bacterium]|nr:hypothetical protein [Planctomycetota bacterium]